MNALIKADATTQKTCCGRIDSKLEKIKREEREESEEKKVFELMCIYPSMNAGEKGPIGDM